MQKGMKIFCCWIGWKRKVGLNAKWQQAAMAHLASNEIQYTKTDEAAPFPPPLLLNRKAKYSGYKCCLLTSVMSPEARVWLGAGVSARNPCPRKTQPELPKHSQFQKSLKHWIFLAWKEGENGVLHLKLTDVLPTSSSSKDAPISLKLF